MGCRVISQPHVSRPWVCPLPILVLPPPPWCFFAPVLPSTLGRFESVSWSAWWLTRRMPKGCTTSNFGVVFLPLFFPRSSVAPTVSSITVLPRDLKGQLVSAVAGPCLRGVPASHGTHA